MAVIVKTGRTCKGRPVFQLTTPYGTYDVVFAVGTYRNGGSLAVMLYNIDYEEDPPRLEPYTRLTVNVDPYVETPRQDGTHAYLDYNNNPEAEDIVREAGIAKRAGVETPCGYCVYPLYEFDRETLEAVSLTIGKDI